MMGRPLRLELRNAHQRDKRIQFEEHAHRYILDGSIQFPISVTGVWERFFSTFDAAQIIDKYFDKSERGRDLSRHDLEKVEQGIITPEGDLCVKT